MQIASTPRTPSPHAKKLLLSFHGVLLLQIVLGSIVLAIGLLITSLCGLVLYEEISTWHGAISVEAKIISAEKEPDTDGDLRYQASYEYSVGGDKSYQGTTSLSVSKGTTVEIGQPLKILASTSVPGASREPGFDAYSGPFILLAVLGLPFFLLGGNISFRAVREIARRRRIYRNGTLLPARILSLEEEQPQTFRLSWEFILDEKPYRGFLTSTKLAPLQEIAAGEFSVLCLPQNPSHSLPYLP